LVKVFLDSGSTPDTSTKFRWALECRNLLID